MTVHKTEKNSVRIELAGGLDYLRLQEYPWIFVSLTVTILDRLEKPVLLFHFAAYHTLKVGSSLAGAFEGLDNKDLEAFR